MDNENKALELYKQKGLTEEEAGLVERYVDEDRSCLSRVKADQLAIFFLLGYSCQDLNDLFPEYSLPMLLFTRVQFDWDKMKAEYQEKASKSAVDAALTIKLESIRFVTNILAATHAKYTQDIIKFLAAPDREKAPSILPNTLHGYSSMLGLLSELTALPGEEKNKKKGSAGAVPLNGQGPLVSINVTQTPGEKPAIQVSATKEIPSDRAKRIRDEMVADMDKKKV